MIGIDEVGRGAWAGPLLVVTAGQTSQLLIGLADSKNRERLLAFLADLFGSLERFLLFFNGFFVDALKSFSLNRAGLI